MTDFVPPSLFSPQRVRPEETVKHSPSPRHSPSLPKSPSRRTGHQNSKVFPTALTRSFDSKNCKLPPPHSSAKFFRSMVGSRLAGFKDNLLARGGGLKGGPVRGFLEEVPRSNTASKTKSVRSQVPRQNLPPRFVEPQALPKSESPQRIGKYLVRVFDGQLCETREERENCLLRRKTLAKSPKRSPRFTKSQTNLQQEEQSPSSTKQGANRDPKFLRRVSYRPTQLNALLPVDLKRITDLNKILSLEKTEESLEEQQYHHPSDSIQSRFSPLPPDSPGTGATLSQGPFQMSFDESVRQALPSIGHGSSFAARSRLIGLGSVSRSHSPRTSKRTSPMKRLGIVGQSLHTLRYLKQQHQQTRTATMDVGLQTAVFDDIERLVRSSLSPETQLKEEQHQQQQQQHSVNSSAIMEGLQAYHRRTNTEPEYASPMLPKFAEKSQLSEYSPDLKSLKGIISSRNIQNTQRLMQFKRRTEFQNMRYKHQAAMNGFIRRIKGIQDHRDSSSGSNSTASGGTPQASATPQLKVHSQSLFAQSQEDMARSTKSLRSKRLAAIISPRSQFA